MTPPSLYRFEPFRLLPAQRLLLRGDEPVKLGGRAFDVLLALVERRHRTVTKHELMDLVWPGLVVEENNLQVQVAALRKLLGHAALATVPGRGYQFTLPVDRGDDAASSEAPVPAPLVEVAPNNLPPVAPVLLGRDEDLRALLGLLERERLVTLAGPGGIGKSRLALAAAAARLPALPDGAWWVDLAPLTDAGLIADAVALAMGIGLDGARDVPRTVLAALRERDALLVLDNAEHLIDGVAAFVDRCRAEAPCLRLLITSQELLRADGEQVLRPEPLTLPADDEPASIDASGAVRLFVARAQAVDRRFALGPDNRAAVADICRRLDGMPLAIELAASRLPLLGVQGLRDRLDQRLSVLTAGARTALRRHRTLRATLEWSHQLLSRAEQTVLARLGVFAGGFTLAAAQQVAAREPDIDGWDVLEHLGALVDKSLVVAEGDALPRYRLLESTRLFALERLIESGQAAEARSRHREHFADLAVAAREWMLVGDPRGLATLDRERDNLFLALAWAQDDPQGRQGLRLAAGLRYYWTSRGLLARGRSVMREALDRPGADAPGVDRCVVQGSLGQLYSWMGDQDAALREAGQALAMARGLGDPGCLCQCAVSLGFVHLRRGETAQAAALADEALQLGERIGDGHERGTALSLRAGVLDAGGDPLSAMAVLREAAAMRRRLGQPWSEALTELNLAQLSVNAGRAEDALPHIRRVLELLPRVDSQFIGLHLMGMSAEWAAASGRHAWSVLLDAACVRHHARVGMEDHLDEAQRQRLAGACRALPEAEVARLQERGRALAYDDALLQVRLAVAGQAEP
ncbi:MAG: winged helix-turn-helix domain-containing protein [Rubrivivax sp.]